MDLLRLSDRVYAYEDGRRATGFANAGLIAAGGGIVVDTLYDVRLASALADAVARVQTTPVARVVNTHHNGDHCWGNQVFAGAEIIAHRGCAQRFAEFTPEQAVRMAGQADPPERHRELVEELSAFDFTEVVLTPPTTVIDGDLRLELDGTTVELLHVGPAHTAGDLVVWAPGEGVLFAGDVLFHQCTPIGWEGSTDAWLAALRRIEDLRPAHVVPGHGPVCDVDGVREARGYLEYVQREAREGWSAGRAVVDTCLRLDLGPYRHWTHPHRVASTVHRVYRECEGRRWDEPFDAVAVMEDVHAVHRALSSAHR